MSYLNTNMQILLEGYARNFIILLKNYVETFDVLISRNLCEGRHSKIPQFHNCAPKTYLTKKVDTHCNSVWKLRKFSLTLFCQKFHESNIFTKEITYELISQKKNSVRENFSPLWVSHFTKKKSFICK